MRLAAYQMVARAGDIAGNLAMIAEAARRAKAAGADLLVAPELATTGYGAGEAIRRLAEPADGSQVARLAALAAEHRLAIVSGFAERDGPTIYNSAILVDTSGRHVVHRKCRLYGDYEKALFAPGSGLPAIMEVGGAKIGLLICYDVEFPELVRDVALAGADLIAVPTAVPQTLDAAFIAEKMIPVRAFENQIAVVYADHAGNDGNFAFAGRSCIIMADGSDGARAGPAGEALIVAEYVAAHYDESRIANPYIEDIHRAPFR